MKPLFHSSSSRDLTPDDEFWEWVKSLPAEYWSKKDITACAIGWNAGAAAALRVAAQVCFEEGHECNDRNAADLAEVCRQRILGEIPEASQ